MFAEMTNQSFASLQANMVNENEQNLNASFIFDTHRMILGNEIKNLVILIPNEGHHGPQQDEDRFIDQSFVPETAIVNKGTNVMWFSGDVGHEHNLVVTDNLTGEALHETGALPEFESRNLILNESGDYRYQDTEEYEEGFVMKGNIQVVDQTDPSSPLSTDSTGTSADIAGILMVPTQEIQAYIGDLENKGFDVHSTHNFKDLRGGQSGTGDEQTLVVWTASSSTVDLSTIISNLREFSSTLPYS
jgi:plastocyanin